MIEVVAFACRGTLLDWTRAVDAVAYELARRNGESPLDRGAALGRRAEALARGHGLRHGFERLAGERSYRVGTDADELLADVVALARPLPGACGAVALATASAWPSARGATACIPASRTAARRWRALLT